MKDWFKARNIWGAAITALSDEEAGRLAKAIWAFTMNGEITEIEGAGKGILAMILLTLGQDAERDDEISVKRSMATAGIRCQKMPDDGKSNQMISNDIKCNQMISNDDNKNKNKNIDKEKESESESNIRPMKRFIPPTVDEVKEYCDERGVYLIDPQQFVDYYEARGWMLTKNRRMVDWRAAVRTWEKNERDRQKERVIADLPY